MNIKTLSVFSTIGEGLYYCCYCIGKFMYYIEQLFFWLAGSTNTVYGATLNSALNSGISLSSEKIGENESVVLWLFHDTTITKFFRLFLLVGAFVLVLSLVISIVKNNLKEKGSIKEPVVASLKAILTILFIPVCLSLLINASCTIITVILNFFGKKMGEGTTSLTDAIFKTFFSGNARSIVKKFSFGSTDSPISFELNNILEKGVYLSADGSTQFNFVSWLSS